MLVAAAAAVATRYGSDARAQVSNVAAQPLQKVDVLLDWKPLPTYAGFFLAREMGAFERRGLEVTFGEAQGATTAAEMIGDGKKFWIGSSSGMATAIARSKGLPIKSLAVYYRKTPSAVFTRAEDRIAHPRDLYGKKIGFVKGSITNEEFRAMLDLNHLDGSKITQVNVEWDPWALLEKKVDALVDYEEMTPAELFSEGRRLLLLRLSDFGVRTYSLNLIVNEEAWASPEKRAIAQKVAEAVQEGYSLVNERPADAAARFSTLFPRLAPNYVDRSMAVVSQQLNPPPVGAQTRAGWQETINTLSSLGLLAKPITVDDVAIFDN
ncbi:ABC-type nitrate/sulfonate/bicarbonate transport system, substrate-binding protein [Enhydrobacter aerosaccus]|uniref:Thiamine pyrimidine synthase n=2 Tax=Enhydrobacter aerosaccus TaxID=225324 RepID=A0A1T4RKH3_9HYPH|nr:ABC-type nitrate/sulfonate/bicarbonate transport system, substrate-binding protein [Enhydrobacter aerosaccus]